MKFKLLRRRVVFGFLFFVAAIQAGFAVAASPPKTVRLLTVGNSFSRDAMTYLNAIVEADGNVLVLGQAVIGGSGPLQHVEKAALHERDPDDKAGLYSDGKGLKELLTSEPWDFITIQQASIKSHDPANYRPHAAQLRDYIRKNAPQAEVLLHQTWAYRVDDPRFAVSEPKPGEPKTQREMYELLTRAYDEIAAELKVRVIPVGDAFFAADTDETWGYRPDVMFKFASAKPPALPNQTHSLHIGRVWKAAEGKPTLAMDGHHASIAGRYLGGCVFYDFLFDEDVTDNKFAPPQLDAKYAMFLRATAHRVVERRKAGR